MGNSFGVRLRAAIAREAHLYLDQKVKLSIVDGLVVLSPVLGEVLSLDELLAKFDFKCHAGEAMVAAESFGAERRSSRGQSA